MAKKHTVRMMKGSNGHEDYMVLGEHDGILLGFKPRLRDHYVGNLKVGVFSAKLRSASADGTVSTAEALTEAWPAINFKAGYSHSGTRASVIVGGAILGRENSPELKDNFEAQDVAGVFATKLVSYAGNHATASIKEVQDFLRQQFEPRLVLDEKTLAAKNLKFFDTLGEFYGDEYRIAKPYSTNYQSEEDLAEEDDLGDC